MLTVSEVRSLLEIQSRDTMNEDLKALGLFGCDRLMWSQIRKLLEMRKFLGLKPGIHSREQFLRTSKEQLNTLFVRYGLNIEEQFQLLQTQQQGTHRVTVQLVLERD
ncbi:MAG: hypothetical protein V7K67_34010 [Nostoc sp.]|uniref:hypothetical protein n=1 Tax=Nostoc sp. TaxID=1180 RepID=UPI002FF5FE1F